MQIEASTVIGRSLSVVWDFYAVHHVENHPRWDPSLELEATSDAPIGVGTLIKRRATRFGRTTDGTMEVLEFAPERVMRVETHDGPMTIFGYARFEPLSHHETRLTIGGEFPGLDETMAAQLKPMIEHSAATIKSLVESET
jgi:hypothetical protein